MMTVRKEENLIGSRKKGGRKRRRERMTFANVCE
jgi:hypothetical protein